jgi:hypothetical protein
MKHALFLALLLLACADTEPPANQVSGVRILATSADKPFAKPGESVTLNVLAVDGRATQTAPMRTYFLPVPCVNPERDDVEKCFATLAKNYPIRTNLNARFVEGPTVTLALPNDIIDTHAPAPFGLPYGIAYGFVIACAGHIERIEYKDTSAFTPPFGCFNEQGELLSKDDYVFAHARVLAYADLRNANPVLDVVTVNGKALDESGFSLSRCFESDERNCTKSKVDAQIAESAQELDFTSSPAGSGSIVQEREQLWVSYFVTSGKMESDLSVIYDAQDGKLPKTENGLFVKDGTGTATRAGMLYAVAHDNRGGVSWRQFPFTIQ